MAKRGAAGLVIDGRPAGILVRRGSRGSCHFLMVTVCTYAEDGSVRGVTGGVYDALGFRTYADDRAGGAVWTELDAALAGRLTRHRSGAGRVRTQPWLATGSRVLTRLQTAMDTMAAVEGTPTSVGQAVNRLARALKVGTVTIYDQERERRDGNGTCTLTRMGDVAWYVDQAVARWFPAPAPARSGTTSGR